MALDPGTLRRLRRPLALTRLGLAAERGVRAFWPLWVVAALALALWLGGIIPEGVLWSGGLWGGLQGLAVIFAAWGIRRFRWPGLADAVARLDAGLTGRPLAALADHPAIGAQDASGMALWQAHQSRMQIVAMRVRAPFPDLRLSARDPFALRYLALLALSAVLLFGGAHSAGSGGEVARPTGAPGAAWEGWAEPPRYTGRPVLYLNDQPDGPLSVPQGTRFDLRFYDDATAFRVSESLSGRAETGDPNTGFAATQNGDLTIAGHHWQITVEPDVAPGVMISGPAERVRGGGFSLPFLAEDDFGVRMGQARITLDLAQVPRRYGLAADPAPRDPILLDLPLPYTRDRSAIESALTDDLSTHPWANLPVIIRLSVTDDAGQTGHSEAMPMELPGKRFFEPLAAALAEQRRDLLWAPQANGPRVVRLLRAAMWQPENLFRKPEHIAEFRSIVAEVESQISAEFSDPKALTTLTGRMWDLALELEEGAIDDARERLDRARERLSDAMQRGADPSEIAELMDELRSATDAYMDLLAENALPEESQIDEPDSDAQTQTMSMAEIQRMMDQIQQLMEEGRMDEAQALMDQLNQLLDNLQMQEGGEGDPSGRRRQMEELGDTLRDQQDLSDDAFRELQDRFNGRSPEDGEKDALDDLADRQRALQDALDQQRDQLPGLTGEEADAAREALEQAGDAMNDAADALGRGDLPGALDGQARALEALRDGLQHLDDAFDREDGQPGGDPAAENGDQMRLPDERDPLGREAGRGDPQGAQGGTLEGGPPRARAQELLEELRRRAGDLTRPDDERDYLGRLLERF